MTAICNFTVTVNDAQPPEIRCSENIIVDNDRGVCGAKVDFASAATDYCTRNVALSHSITAGSVFPVGITTITATATDESNNRSSCSFTITVRDSEPPRIGCPANRTLSCEQSILPETAGNPLATDNCAVQDAHYTDVKAAGYSYGPGGQSGCKRVEPTHQHFFGE